MPSNPPKLIDIASLPFRPYLVGSFIVNILMVVLALGLQSFLPPQIPLFYGVAEGEGQLARAIFLFIPNAFALIIIVANIFIATLIEEEFVKKILITSGIIATFFATITTLKIFFLVESL